MARFYAPLVFEDTKTPPMPHSLFRFHILPSVRPSFALAPALACHNLTFHVFCVLPLPTFFTSICLQPMKIIILQLHRRSLFHHWRGLLFLQLHRCKFQHESWRLFFLQLHRSSLFYVSYMRIILPATPLIFQDWSMSTILPTAPKMRALPRLQVRNILPPTPHPSFLPQLEVRNILPPAPRMRALWDWQSRHSLPGYSLTDESSFTTDKDYYFYSSTDRR